jgi:hypothetical protein
MTNASATWMAASADGRLEVFVIGHPEQAGGFEGFEVWHLYQTAPAGGWSQWVSHGRANPEGGWIPPRVAASADGRLELFTSIGGGDLQHIWQTAPNNGWTPTWTSHGMPPGTIGVNNNALTRLPDGRLILFNVATAPASTEALWHIEQTAPSNGWSTWSSLGGPPSGGFNAVAVAPSADGRLEVFGMSNFALWHIWQQPGGGWSAWTSHGTPPGTVLVDAAPVLAANTQGRLELFIVGSDRALWHIWQTTPSGGWSDWTSHGSPPGCQLNINSPGMAAGADGRLELFLSSTDGQLWHIWQTTPSGGWSSWTSHGRPPQTDPTLPAGVQLTPAVALNSARRLELFVTGLDNSLWHIWQTAPGQGWSDWLSHGKPPGVDVLYGV